MTSSDDGSVGLKAAGFVVHPGRPAAAEAARSIGTWLEEREVRQVLQVPRARRELVVHPTFGYAHLLTFPIPRAAHAPIFTFSMAAALPLT